MKKITIGTCFCAAVLFLLNGSLLAAELHKTFSAQPELKITLVSGDAIVRQGPAGEIKVDLTHTYTADEFTAIMEEKAGVLELREDFHGRGTHQGHSRWTVSIPAATRVDFSSASGSGDIRGLNAAVTFKTASGDLQLENISGDVTAHSASGTISLAAIKGNVSCSLASGDLQASGLEGDVQVKSASGSITLKEVKGRCQAKTASGDLDVSGLELQDPAVLSTASGSVLVSLKRAVSQDMTLSSASGDVTLDCNGQPIQGTFEFRVSKHHGDIICPVAFDRQEEIENGSSITVVKTFTRGSGPKFTLKSASGTVTLKK
jgi:DUF4097 and DUF4098 domain-containing protein YvlB